MAAIERIRQDKLDSRIMKSTLLANPKPISQFQALYSNRQPKQLSYAWPKQPHPQSQGKGCVLLRRPAEYNAICMTSPINGAGTEFPSIFLRLPDETAASHPVSSAILVPFRRIISFVVRCRPRVLIQNPPEGARPRHSVRATSIPYVK